MSRSFHPLSLILYLFSLHTIHATAITTTSATINNSICTPQSIAACPKSYDPCCAYICAEAQVPFQVCAPSNRTVLAQCTQCPSPTALPTTNTIITNTTVTITGNPSFTTPSNPPYPTITKIPRSSATAPIAPSGSGTGIQTTLATSTCTPRLLTAGQTCPTPYDPCCAWKCAEAQVPFDVCQPTDGSGEFAVCERCPTG